MPKSLRTFIEDCQRELPGEVIHISKEVDPANYDVTAIIKHLGAQKKFPIIVFDKPRNLNGKVGPIKLTMNCEISTVQYFSILHPHNLLPAYGL